MEDGEEEEGEEGEEHSEQKEVSSHFGMEFENQGINVDEYIGGNEINYETGPSSQGFLSVCGVDCEMCYTSLGLELARVSDLKIFFLPSFLPLLPFLSSLIPSIHPCLPSFLPCFFLSSCSSWFSFYFIFLDFFPLIYLVLFSILSSSLPPLFSLTSFIPIGDCCLPRKGCSL